MGYFLGSCFPVTVPLMRDNLDPPVDEEDAIDQAAVRWAVLVIGIIGGATLAIWIWWTRG